MTNTPHGQVPEALIDLIDAYAETRHRCGGIYTAKTEAARNAVIEALSGVQALSAAPGEPPGIQALMCVISSLRDIAHFSEEEGGELMSALCALRDWANAQTVAAPQPAPAEQEEVAQRLRKTLDIDPGDVNDPLHPRYIAGFKSGHAAGRRRADAAASPTPPAEQAAPKAAPGEPDPADIIAGALQISRGHAIEMMREALEAAPQQAAPKVAPVVGNSGFDHKTAADFLNGKTVSDEAVRTFVAVSRWAHDERAALSATLLAMHGVLTSREEEIALLKKALLEAEAAPQQEVQEPCGWTTGITWRPDTRLQSEQVIKITRDTQPKYGYTIPIYTAPQPAPLSDDTDRLREALQRIEGASMSMYATRSDMLEHFQDIARAALAAQGGKDA